MWRKLYRKLKYEYYKLIRMKGAPSIIARGFAVGIFIEFILLPTFLVAFLLLFPLTRLLRCSFPASLIGFVIGKIILPIFMLPILKVGNIILGKKPPMEGGEEHGFLHLIKHSYFAYLTGSAVLGLIVAIASYFLVSAALQWYRKKRARRALVQQN